MTGLIKYEFLKLVGHKAFVLIIPMLLIANLFIFLNDNRLPSDFELEREIVLQMEYHAAFPLYIASMEERLRDMQRVTIFNTPGTFAFRNAERTPRDFAHLYGIELAPGTGKGIAAVVNNRFADFFIMVILILTCYILFLDEKDRKLNSLLKVNKKGRLPLIASKLVVLCIVAAGAAILYFSADIFVAYRVFGFGDMGRYIQSIPSFSDMTLLVTVRQFLLLFLATKLVAVLTLAFVLALIFSFARDATTAYVGAVIFMGASGMAYTFIHPLSSWNILKYVNIFALFDVSNLYGFYVNLNVFGFAFFRAPIAIGFFLVLACVCGSIVCLQFCFSDSEGISFLSKLPPIGAGRNLRGTVNSVSSVGSVSLLRHEAYKIFVINKVWIVFAVAIIIFYGAAERGEKWYLREDYVYLGYVHALEGLTGAEIDAFMSEERFRFDNIGLSIAALSAEYESGEIDALELTGRSFELSVFAQGHEAFIRAEEQYAGLSEIADRTGIPVRFVNEIATDYIFNQPLRDMLNGILFTIFVTLCTANVFPYDYKGKPSVLTTTKRGKQDLAVVKTFISCAMVIALYILIFLPENINLIRYYRFNGLMAPIQSVANLYGYVNAGIDIFLFILVRHIIGISASLLATVTVLNISALFRRSGTTVAIAFLLFTAPIAIGLLGVRSARLYTFCAVFNFYGNMAYHASLWPYAILIVFMLCAAVLTHCLANPAAVVGKLRKFTPGFLPDRTT